MLRPMIVVYRLSWVSYLVARAPRADCPLRAREHPRRPGHRARAAAGEASPERMAAEIERLLGDRAARDAQLTALREVRASLGEPGAPRRVAEEVGDESCHDRKTTSARLPPDLRRAREPRAHRRGHPRRHAGRGRARHRRQLAGRHRPARRRARGARAARAGAAPRREAGARARRTSPASAGRSPRLRVRARDGRGLLARPALPPGPPRPTRSRRGPRARLALRPGAAHA